MGGRKKVALMEIVGKQAEVVVTTIKTANGVLKDIRHKAIEVGITISEIVTKALKDYLEKEKKKHAHIFGVRCVLRTSMQR